jgi:hypothetical protein
MHNVRKLLIVSALTLIMAGAAGLVFLFAKDTGKRLPARLAVADGIYISPWYNDKDDTFYFFLPSYADTETMCLKTENGQELSFNDIPVKDGGNISRLSTGKTYNILDKKYGKKYKAKILKSENTAAVYVSTVTGSMDNVYNSKETKEVAKITVADENGNIVFDTAGARIKGRGNSTWVDHDKKPFSIILDEACSILGMGQCSKWVLLANADDPSGIRNAVIFDTARAAGMADVSEYRFTDLYLNGEYNGMYMLCQSYDRFYEWNGQGEESLFLFSAELPERAGAVTNMLRAADNEAIIDVVLPKTLNDKEMQKAGDIVKGLDDAILSGNGSFGEMADMASWVRKYLTDEIFENYDSGLTSSYFHVYSESQPSKVFAGPLWDYDNSMGGTINTENPEIIYAGQKYRTKNERILWYNELLSDQSFYNEMLNCFETRFLPLTEALVKNGIDDLAQKLAASKNNDDIRWNTATDDEYDRLKDYLRKRLGFLKNIWLENKEYCVVSYYDGTPDRDINRIYIPKGSALSEFPEYIKMMGEDAEWHTEGTAAVFDPDAKLDGDVLLVRTASGQAVKKPGFLSRLKQEKVIVCIGSFAFMWMLPAIFALRKRHGRGVS